MNRKQAFLDKYRLARTRRGIDPLAGLGHLERGPLLGQPSFVDHLRSHLWLLAWIRRVGPLTAQPLPVDLRQRLE